MSRERKTFSDNLKTLMNNNGVNRKKLSADLGISYNTITSWVITFSLLPKYRSRKLRCVPAPDG